MMITDHRDSESLTSIVERMFQAFPSDRRFLGKIISENIIAKKMAISNASDQHSFGCENH